MDRNKRIETRQLDEYLRAFNQIREVTGLSDIHKMVERFVAQESSMSQLEQMIKEMQSKLDVDPPSFILEKNLYLFSTFFLIFVIDFCSSSSVLYFLFFVIKYHQY